MLMVASNNAVSPFVQFCSLDDNNLVVVSYFLVILSQHYHYHWETMIIPALIITI